MSYLEGAPPFPRQTLPSPPALDKGLTPLTQQRPNPSYLGGVYGKNTPFGRISNAYTEKFPGTFGRYTVAGAYPASVAAQIVPPPQGISFFMMPSKKTMIIAGVLAILTVAGIWYFSKKGKGKSWRKLKSAVRF